MFVRVLLLSLIFWISQPVLAQSRIKFKAELIPISYPGFRWHLNATGTVVGQELKQDLRLEAFLYSGGSLKKLGNFGRDDSWPVGINDSGHILIYATASYKTTEAFLLKDGDIKPLGSAQEFGYPVAINNFGQILTSGFNDLTINNPDGTKQDIEITDGFGGLYIEMNNRGEVVGTEIDDLEIFGFGLANKYFVFQKGVKTLVADPVVDINDSGMYVGYEDRINGDMFVSINGIKTVLSSVGDRPRQINNRGSIIGIRSGGTGFLRLDGAFIDLEEAVGFKGVPMRLNDREQILYVDVNNRVYLLTPLGNFEASGSQGVSVPLEKELTMLCALGIIAIYKFQSKSGSRWKARS
jgi:hypothetical protein